MVDLDSERRTLTTQDVCGPQGHGEIQGMQRNLSVMSKKETW